MLYYRSGLVYPQFIRSTSCQMLAYSLISTFDRVPEGPKIGPRMGLKIGEFLQLPYILSNHTLDGEVPHTIWRSPSCVATLGGHISYFLIVYDMALNLILWMCQQVICQSWNKAALSAKARCSEYICCAIIFVIVGECGLKYSF